MGGWYVRNDPINWNHAIIGASQYLFYITLNVTGFNKQKLFVCLLLMKKNMLIQIVVFEMYLNYLRIFNQPKKILSLSIYIKTIICNICLFRWFFKCIFHVKKTRALYPKCSGPPSVLGARTISKRKKNRDIYWR